MVYQTGPSIFTKRIQKDIIGGNPKKSHMIEKYWEVLFKVEVWF